MMNCRYGTMAAQLDSECARINGNIDTLTGDPTGTQYVGCVHKYNDPSNPRAGTHPSGGIDGNLGVGLPYTKVWLNGLITRTNWWRIKRLPPMDPRNLPVLLNQWVNGQHHNKTWHPERWGLMKYYKEFVFQIPAEDWPTYQCPPIISAAQYPPRPDGAMYLAQGVRCPKYWQLTPCTACGSTYKSGRKRLYLETANTFNFPAGGVIQHPANPTNWPRMTHPFKTRQAGRSSLRVDWPHCYTYAAIPRGPKTGPGDTLKSIQWIDQTTYDTSYVHYEDCSPCLQDFIIAVSEAGRADGCSRVDQINNYANPAFKLPINLCISSGKMVVRRVRADAFHVNLFKFHNNKFWYFANGKCFEVRVVDCPTDEIKLLAYYGLREFPRGSGNWRAYWPNVPPGGIRLSGPPRPTRLRVAFYTNFYRLARPGNNFGAAPKTSWSGIDGRCDCAKDSGGSVGTFNPICFPPVPMPVIIKHPFHTEPRNKLSVLRGNALGLGGGVGNQVTISVTATVAAGGMPLRYQWYKNGARIAGATNRTLVILNPQVVHSGTYKCRVSNGGGGPPPLGNVNTVISNAGELRVVNGPTIMRADNTVVYRIRTIRYCPDNPGWFDAQGGKPGANNPTPWAKPVSWVRGAKWTFFSIQNVWWSLPAFKFHPTNALRRVPKAGNAGKARFFVSLNTASFSASGRWEVLEVTAIDKITWGLAGTYRDEDAIGNQSDRYRIKNYKGSYNFTQAHFMEGQRKAVGCYLTDCN
jgi:hypothetical protein